MKVYMANKLTSIFPLGIIAKGEILGQKHIDALGSETIADMVRRNVLVEIGEDEDANAKSESERINAGNDDGDAKENPGDSNPGADDHGDGETGDGETGESEEAADSEDANGNESDSEDANDDDESDGEDGDDGEGSEEIDADAMDAIVNDKPEPAPKPKSASQEKNTPPKKREGGKAK